MIMVVFIVLFYLTLVFWLTSAAIGLADSKSNEAPSNAGYQVFSLVMSSLVIVGSALFAGLWVRAHGWQQQQ
jgi:hypothetical protein